MGVSPKSDRIQGETQLFKIFESELPSEEAELLNL